MLQPNLSPQGRALRATASALCAVAALPAWPASRILAGSLVVAATILAFEAARGWCALRACGINTRL